MRTAARDLIHRRHVAGDVRGKDQELILVGIRNVDLASAVAHDTGRARQLRSASRDLKRWRSIPVTVRVEAQHERALLRHVESSSAVGRRVGGALTAAGSQRDDAANDRQKPRTIRHRSSYESQRTTDSRFRGRAGGGSAAAWPRYTIATIRSP